jgi:serine/threonine protein kinase
MIQDEWNHVDDGPSLSHHGSPSKRHQSFRRRKETCFGLFQRRHRRNGWHWSSHLLAVSLIAWTGVQTTCYFRAPSITVDHPSLRTAKNQERPRILPRHHRGNGDSRHPPDSLLHGNDTILPRRKRPNVEALAPGCEYAEWQREKGSRLLHCNALHELDLQRWLGRSFGGTTTTTTRRHRRKQRHGAIESDGTINHTHGEAPSLGRYLSSGLWRDVWSLSLDADFLHGNDVDHGKAVLKMMKMEHDVVERNFERHRREAVTMDRLSASPYVVDLFAYCGNTVLTEFAPQDLSTAIKGSREAVKNGRKRHTKGQNTPIDQHRDNALARDLTAIERLHLALQAARGVQALHETDIMHADLTAKQFLLTKSCDVEGVCTTMLKINDFNRCRFIPHKSNSTTAVGMAATEKCSVRIPSAPGLYRSPEEYAAQNLTAQIDVFSLGNVLYELWTGKEPWDDVGGKLIRRHVQDGHLPSGLTDILNAGEGHANDQVASLNYAMGTLIAECYNPNPNKRIAAEALAKKLEEMIGKLEAVTPTWLKVD